MSEIIHKDLIQRYRAILEAIVIDFDSFDFNGKTVTVMVSMILLVYIYYLSIICLI